MLCPDATQPSELTETLTKLGEIAASVADGAGEADLVQQRQELFGKLVSYVVCCPDEKQHVFALQAQEALSTRTRQLQSQ